MRALYIICTKSISAIIVILILCSCNENQHSEFKGNIKSISEKNYSCSEKFGEVIKKDLIDGATYSFENKVLTKYIHYNAEGEKENSFERELKDGSPFRVTIEYSSYIANTFDKMDISITEKLIERNSNTEKWERIINNRKDTIYRKIDKYGYMLLQNEKDEKGNLLTTENRLGKNGNLIEFKRSINNEIIYNYKSKFNKDNFEIERETFDIENKYQERVTYEYKTDDVGNWIERISFKDNEPTVVTVRDIKYN